MWYRSKLFGWTLTFMVFKPTGEDKAAILDWLYLDFENVPKKARRNGIYLQFEDRRTYYREITFNLELCRRLISLELRKDFRVYTVEELLIEPR